jgi:hypothetical protein
MILAGCPGGISEALAASDDTDGTLGLFATIHDVNRLLGGLSGLRLGLALGIGIQQFVFQRIFLDQWVFVSIRL